MNDLMERLVTASEFGPYGYAHLFQDAAEALAAERERADQAEQRMADALATIRRSLRSKWVSELQANIHRVSSADWALAERILSTTPTAE